MMYDEYEMQNRYEKYKDKLALNTERMIELLGFISISPKDKDELIDTLKMIKKKYKKINKIDDFVDAKKHVKLKVMYFKDNMTIGNGER